MTRLLIRWFIKNPNSTDQVKVRTAYGALASMIGIICNFILFVGKLIIGILINSISIMADAFNNLSDAGSSIISLIGVKLAKKPADKEHPFGHGRIEYVAALVVAFLILFVGVSLFKDALKKAIQPEEVGFSWIIVIILSLSILIKAWLALFYQYIGKRIQSNLMKATSTDARNDVIVTSATILSIIIENQTGFAVDGWIGIVVSIFVVLSGYKIAKDMLMPLLGEPVGKEVYEKITSKVEGYEGIIGSHDLITHNYGPSHIMATIHAEVPSDSNLASVHEIIDTIERDVMKELGISLVIHIDPVEMNDKKILENKTMILDIVKNLEPDATLHDFRVVHLKNGEKLIFDLVVPYSYSDKDKQELLNEVIKNVRKVDRKFQCVITIENSFISEL